GIRAGVEQIAKHTQPLAELLQQVVDGQQGQTALLQRLSEVRAEGIPAELTTTLRDLTVTFKQYGVRIDVTPDHGLQADYSRAQVGRELGESVVEELRAIRRALVEFERAPVPDDTALDGLEAVYRCALTEEHGSLQFPGILQTGQPVALPLSEVFVTLHALPRREEAETPELARLRQRQEELRRRLELRGVPESLRRELQFALEELRRQEELAYYAQRAVETKPQPLDKVWAELRTNRHDALVILGDPGAGKTTLLKYLALTYAQGQSKAAERLDPDEERLPIFVPLAAYDATLREAQKAGQDVSLQEYLSTYYDREKSLSGLRPVFERAMRTGRAVLLLDGLDEVLEAQDRRRIAERIGGLIRALDSGNRVVLTSRIVGYREAPLAADIPHFTLVDWAQEERAHFLSRWLRAFTACSRGEDPVNPSAQAQAEAADLQTKLTTAIEDGPESIRRLAGNPLLLTILTVVFTQEGMKLPRRRVELYARYIRVLIDTWGRVRTPGFEVGGLAEDPQKVEERLAAVALYLQEKHPSGTAPRQAVERVLVETGLAPEAAKKFLDAVHERAGLLVERGRDAFGFLHLTFQEYLAARALAGMAHQERMARIRPHLYDPRWREVIRLTAGRLDLQDDRATKVPEFVAALYDRTPVFQLSWATRLLTIPTRWDVGWLSDYRQGQMERVLQRGLFLAANCLADDVNAGAVVPGQVLNRLLHCLRSPVTPLRERVGESLREFGGTAYEEDVVKLLLTALRDTDSSVRSAAVQALGWCGQATPEVVTALLAALQDKDWDVRSTAAEALGRVRQATPEVVTALLAALRDEDLSVQYAAAGVLERFGQATPEVVTALLAALQDKNLSVQYVATGVLERLGQATPGVVMVLLAALWDEDRYVRSTAAEVLGRVGQATPEVLMALLAALRDEDLSVQYAAAEALGRVGQATPEVLMALLAALRDEDWDVRYAAAMALGRLGQATPDVVMVLLAALRDEDWNVRYTAAEVLEQLGQATPGVVMVLLLVALRDDDRGVRSRAAEALGQLGQATPEVVTALLAALRDEDWHVRSTAAETLEQLGQATPEVVTTLLAAPRDKCWGVSSTTVRMLGRVGQATPEVVTTLLAALRDEHGLVRSVAAEALRQLEQVTPEVVTALLAALRDKDWDVRSTAAEVLGRVGQATPEVVTVLLAALRDKDWDVRSTAAEVLGRVGRPDVRVIAALLQAIHDSWNRDEAWRALERLAGVTV
ncbi:MAG: NACHT domain-containing protein, partial [Chloroflexi bacterium]|nr:NACHT domain-containing protein [Chloroflexota bacterium]